MFVLCFGIGVLFFLLYFLFPAQNQSEIENPKTLERTAKKKLSNTISRFSKINKSPEKTENNRKDSLV